MGGTSALLEPLVETLRRYVMAAGKLHADDTRVPVLDFKDALRFAAATLLARPAWLRNFIARAPRKIPISCTAHGKFC